ncbi:MAG: abortive infection system antitoxin AbiGi family protein [Candidatus Omnitrophota bacterium]|jgi:hypothetical protein
MAVLHTKFLVHWTGKDFHRPTDALDDNVRQQYVDRLIDILRDGFFMQRNQAEDERIYDSEGEWIQAVIARTCFTEIKLSMVKKHAQTYGNLGIGVDREYVIRRYGNPVFYIVNGDYSNIGVCARRVRDFLGPRDEDMLREFEILLGYIKKMGEQNSDDLLFYDELEWRITHLDRLEDEGHIIAQDRDNHIYRIRLSREDIKVLVFPDERTKTLALNRRDVIDLIDKPICVTMDDCENF